MVHFDFERSIKTLKLEGDLFLDEGLLPFKYSCEGDNINPGLWIKNLPENAVSMALIMEDLDAPIKPWIHWVVWNIPVTHHIAENTKRGSAGRNDFNKKKYNGPCQIKGIHHFVFKVYVLDSLLNLNTQSNAYDLTKVMSGHILAYGELTCTYGNPLYSLNQKVYEVYENIQMKSGGIN